MGLANRDEAAAPTKNNAFMVTYRTSRPVSLSSF